jgi:predicted phage baseplate assembly protein
MSLQQQTPNLDNRRYDDIVAEAKSLISRYAPEWTNHNNSDPGITLIQMFAWMTDMLIFRLNQVPELNYIKFLQLLGIELKPALPAHAELTFTLARDDVEFVAVPKETQIAVAGGNSDPLIFETQEELLALGAKLAAVQVFDGYSYTSVTAKNDNGGQWYYPFGANAREGSALLLGFASPLAFTAQVVNLTVLVYTQGLAREGLHCDISLEGMPIPATLQWEYWDRKQWHPLSMIKDDTRGLTRSGHVYFQGPGTDVKKGKLGDVPQELYWLRCRLERSTYERPPRLTRVLTNTVRAAQVATVRDEVLGGSTGRPNQGVRLANTPVIAADQIERVIGADGHPIDIKHVRLEIDEGGGFQVWEEVDDFYESGEQSSHFVLNRTTGEIRFGDGRRGRIPLANPANANTNIVARVYRYGGGSRGNVGAETITSLQSSIPGLDSVTNLFMALGGADEETLPDAKLRAPQALKSKDRAVTAEDFEYLAKETPGVRICRAKALPLFHPRFTGAPIPGVVTVLVVPDSDAPNPIPSEATLQIVCAHLNVHRLLTSEVHVVAPRYRKVKIEAEIVVRPDASLFEVKRQLEDKLTRFFHPLDGGDLGEGWPFGGTIYFSQVYREVFQTQGVERIDENKFWIWLDDERQPFCRDVPIEQNALLYSDGHDIRVKYRS